MILIDTDVAVDLIRNHPPAVAWLASAGSNPFAISGFTAFELHAWCRDRAEQGTDDQWHAERQRERG